MLAKLGSTPFAVVDVETTGVYTGGHDRIIEAAIIRFRPDTGEVEDEYVTLINPKRDVGATSIHGITAGELLHAPEFVEVAGDIGQRLRDAILVGHNIRFELEFLRSEYRRVGIELPAFPALCTLHLAHRVSRAPARTLSACCAAEGIDHLSVHSAYGDAQATLDLLTHYLHRIGGCGLVELGCEHAELPDPCWISIPASGRSLPRCQAAKLRGDDRGYLSRLVARLPGTEGSTVREAEYLCLLDRILEDRVLTREEADSLCAMAREWGLGQTEVKCAHEAYVWALSREVKADGVVTDLEREDLASVCELLGVDTASLNKVLDTPTAAPAASAPTPTATDRTSTLAGKSVCFTGELHGKINGEAITRELAEDLATKAGLIVKQGVSKKLDLLVVADPETQSGKAKKAHECGTRIMAEAVFWKMIGLDESGNMAGAKPTAVVGSGELDVEVEGYERAARSIAGDAMRETTAALTHDGIENVFVSVDGVIVGRLSDEDMAYLEPLLDEGPLEVRAIITATNGSVTVTLVNVPEPATA